MIFSHTNSLSDKQKSQIIQLWNSEYPETIAHSSIIDFDQYLIGLADKHHILLTDDNGVIRAWLIYFIRNEERWFGMILDAIVQGRGIGSQLLNLAKEKNIELNGWVIDHDREVKSNGEKYKSPIGFYEKNGFEILWNTKLVDKKIDGVKIRWAKAPVE